MKSIFLATAAVAALMAAPAFAQDPIGSVGVSYSNAEVEVGGASADGDGYAVDGVVAWQTGGAWTVTTALNIADTDGGDTTFSGAAHLTTLVGEDLRVGGFVGAADIQDETAFTIGAEVQKYLANSTLTGVLAYSTADDLDIDVWSLGADAAFYVNPALRLNVNAGYLTIDALGGDADGFTVGAGAEYQIASTPFSVVGGYNRADVDDVTIDTWTVGLRYSFGGGQQARDRAGANLNSGVLGLLGSL